jgi:hyperosmotically inducible periplasmic protein
MKGFVAVVVAAVLVAGLGLPAEAAAATDSQIKAEVSRQLARLDPGAARLGVDVKDGVVSLSGDVATLWLKEEAVRRALKVEGVHSLRADLVIPSAENDQVLVREVSDRIRKYDLYGVYDNIEGRVSHGRVRLDGAVTEPKKADDILERVAKVKGVQAIDNRIEVLPPSQADDRLRTAIATAIYRDQAFVNYSMVDPPVHVIVNNGHVTLVGFVRSPAEKIKAESIARTMTGVLALENRVQVVGRASN